MKIAVSGTSCTGKSTLVKAFLHKWPMYSTPTKTYRDIIKNNQLSHSSFTNAETQLTILDWMMREQDNTPRKSNVIYDRCPWDALAYTLKSNEDGVISDEVTAAIISLVRESLKGLDIIFWIKHDPNIKIVEDSLRDTNVEYIKQVDVIFKDLFHQYCENLESDIFLPKEDCPAIIHLEDAKTLDDRIQFIGEFLDYKGELIETESSILDPNNADLLEQMIREQQVEIGNDIQMKSILSNIKNIKV